MTSSRQGSHPWPAGIFSVSHCSLVAYVTVKLAFSPCKMMLKIKKDTQIFLFVQLRGVKYSTDPASLN